jgi:hypothetical protein
VLSRQYPKTRLGREFAKAISAAMRFVLPNFYFSERLKFQIRGDFFNALNHTNLSSLDTNVESARFGRLNGTRGSREIQLNGRFSF